MARSGMKEVGLLHDGFFRWDVQCFPALQETRVGKNSGVYD